MSTVNDLPGKQNHEIDEAAIKAQLIAQHERNEVKKTDFPTEIIDLPSKGLLYPEGHPLANGTIEMKYMTAKEEDILTSQSLIKQGVVLDKLFQSMIITPVNYDDLIVGDKNAIMVAARVLGYGKDYDVEVSCQHCNERNKVNVDLTSLKDKPFDESLITPHQNFFEFTLPSSKRKIGFHLLTNKIEKQINDQLKATKQLTAKTGIDKELTTRLKHIIVSVDGNNDVNFIHNFVDNEFFAMDSRAFREYIKQMQPDVDMSFDFVCTKCNELNSTVKLPINVQFFWPGA
jgi:predicted RNA-binding protein with RPS1 domain